MPGTFAMIQAISRLVRAVPACGSRPGGWRHRLVMESLVPGLVLLFAGAAPPAAAQQPATSAATPPAAGTGPILLGPVEVEGEITVRYRVERLRSATKTETALGDVPQSVAVISREVIDDLGMQSMADVVRYVPGVAMGQGEGHRDAPTLRGNSSTADFFVDGVRDDVQYYRDLYNAERIEVLKGPNAMIFGRGGGGGVINRVTKSADGATRAEASFETGSFDHYRVEGDGGTALSDTVAVRLNTVFENSGSFRDYFNVERYGINPSLRYQPSDATAVMLSYEYFDDSRTVDRGIPSQNGRPTAAGRSTFFGNPDLSTAATEVHLASATIKHQFNEALSLRNHTLFGAYDKYYQNVFARNAVNAAGNLNLEAYNAGTARENLFNQTDLTWKIATGPVAHTLLVGLEVGRQWTDNFRNNSAFNPVVSAANPVNFAPVAFNVPNQNNRVAVDVAAFYLQDQIALLPQLDLIAGLRYDRFGVDFDNALNGLDFGRKDGLVSPRAGLVYRPREDFSVYASYSVSYLPSSGDQFAALDASSQALKPERFENFEIGAKWEIAPALAATLALYQLDRTNTRAPGPTAGTIVLTGSQRSRGVELDVSGQINDAWQVLAGYAYQDAEITGTTSAAPVGRRIALVAKHGLSLWNKVRITPMWGAGVGVIHQDDSFASISNAVTLPSFTRIDAALFVTLGERVEGQINVENLFDQKYFATAHNDNNITPGAPTVYRIGLKARF